MAFEFGVFHEFQRRPGQSEAEAFTTAFEQVDAAERWGLDAIWLAEIHMAPERSVCSVPMTIASALPPAPRTSRSAPASRFCPCASRCVWPKTPRPSITLAMGD